MDRINHAPDNTIQPSGYAGDRQDDFPRGVDSEARLVHANAEITEEWKA